jgi:hypothetical protein
MMLGNNSPHPSYIPTIGLRQFVNYRNQNSAFTPYSPQKAWGFLGWYLRVCEQPAISATIRDEHDELRLIGADYFTTLFPLDYNYAPQWQTKHYQELIFLNSFNKALVKPAS